MPQRDISYINLVDFTAGIRSRRGSPLGHRPGYVADGNHDGSAQLDGTWQCYGDANGGLYPLPRRTRVLSQDILDWGEEETWEERFPAGAAIAILDICLMSPVVSTTSIGFEAPPLPDALFVSYFWYEDGGEGVRTRAIGRQHKMYLGDITHPVYTLWNEDEAAELVEDEGDRIGSLAYSSWFTSRAAYGIEDFDDPNINLIGLIQMRGFISVVSSDELDGAIHLIAAYPANEIESDPASDTVNIPDGIQNNKGEVAWMLGHQGRSVFGMRRTGPDQENQFLEPFGENGVMPIGEAVSWSDVNFAFLKFEGTIFTERTAFVEENPSGYAVFTSMNANELFLVKNKGGAVVLRGSLNNPTVVKLAGVEPARGAMNIPAITPEGCYYGSTSGVWLWSGADTSQCVSPQLDGFFWETGPYIGSTRPGLKGRFCYSYPFVYAPNDWVYDVRTKGWFRLVGRVEDSEVPEAQNTNPYMFYDTSWDGRVYASPGGITPSDNCVADIFDGNFLATAYKWKSQPFTATMNTDVEFKRIILVAQGQGTVTITIEGLSDTEVTPESFEIDSPDRPVRFEVITTCRATDPQVTIYSSTDSLEVTACAPVVHAVHLGYTQTLTIPADNGA